MDFSRRFSQRGEILGHPIARACLLLFVVGTALCPGLAASEPDLPKVLMVEMRDVTPDDPDLYKAIRAQLSASPLILDRIEADEAAVQGLAQDPSQGASNWARTHFASMVFWIRDDPSVCTMFFYIKDAGGGRIQTRELNLTLNNRSSRFETIANAASSVIEECIASLRPAAAPPPKKTPTPKPLPPKEPPKKRYRVELFADYSGSLFASRKVMHGVQMGVGLLPADHVAVALSYIQSMPVKWETDRYRLTVTSRNIELQLEGRWGLSPLDVRLGVAGSVDLRSPSTVSSSNTITPRPATLQGIYTLGPFLTVTWSFLDRFALWTSLGASLAFNERDYRILRDDGEQIAVLKPFIAKLTFRLGLLVRL